MACHRENVTTFTSGLKNAWSYVLLQFDILISKEYSRELNSNPAKSPIRVKAIRLCGKRACAPYTLGCED